MTTASSMLLLDLLNTSAAKVKPTVKSPRDIANSLMDKEKTFSSIYGDKLQARGDNQTCLADLAMQKQMEADRAKSRQEKNQSTEKSWKDDQSRQINIASGLDLPLGKVVADETSANHLQKKERVARKGDGSESSGAGWEDTNVGPEVIQKQTADDSISKESREENGLQGLVDTLAQADGSENASGDELVEDFIAALATIYSRKANVEGGSVKSEGLLSDELTTGDVKKSLVQLLQNLMRSQFNGESASEENKGADVSQLFKSMIGKMMSKGVAGFTDTGVENLDTLLAKLGDGAQTKLLAQTLVQGQLAMQMSSTRVDSSLNVPYVTSLQQAVTNPEFKDGMGQKLVWMVGQNIQSAKVHLNPAELGPIEMKIQVIKDQAHVQIHSPHAVTRDLMEGTVHRLREMLAEQGIELSRFDVSSQHGEQSGAEGSGQDGSDGDLAGGDNLEDEVQIVEQALSNDQLVDTFA